MMTDENDIKDIAAGWLTAFETALSGSSSQSLQDMFAPDCYWRDVLALTWNLRINK